MQDDEKLLMDDPNLTPSKKQPKKKSESEQLMEGFNEFYGLVPPPYHFSFIVNLLPPSDFMILTTVNVYYYPPNYRDCIR